MNLIGEYNERSWRKGSIYNLPPREICMEVSEGSRMKDIGILHHLTIKVREYLIPQPMR